MTNISGFKTNNFSLVVEETKDRYGSIDTLLINGVKSDTDELKDIIEGILKSYPYLLEPIE